MENVRKLLDEVKAKKNLSSDNALASALGLRRQRISDFYKGERTPDNYVCKQIAEILQRPLAVVIATVEMDAEKDESRQEVWRDYFKSISRQAAATALSLLFVILSSTPAPAEAAPIKESGNKPVCIMSSWRGRKWLEKLKLQGFVKMCKESLFALLGLRVLEMKAI